MSDEKESSPGLSVMVNETGVEAKLSSGTIARLGAAASWLFPNRDAKVVVTRALAERVADKIRKGDLLDLKEQGFVSLIFDKEARRLGNQQAVAERVLEVLPEVSAQLSQLPPQDDRGTSAELIGRSESIASEFTDTRLRDMFARVLAGEIARPGSFSFRTLETVRVMDQNVAQIFDRFRKFLFDAEHVIYLESGDEMLKKYGVPFKDRLELQDAGLIDDSVGVTLKPGSKSRWKYGDRVLRIEIPNEAPEAWISTIRLTRPAREIAQVLPPIVSDEYFNEIGHGLASELGKKGNVFWKTVDGSWTPFV